jgi:hypothetical protein
MRNGICLVLVSMAAASASGRDLFVSNTGGDDRSRGLQAQSTADRAGPVQTIRRALQFAEMGDRIIVQNTGQPYRESLSLVGCRNSGFAGRPLMIQGNGAVLDGSSPVPPDQWQHTAEGVFRFRPPVLGQQQLFLQDRPLPQVPASRLVDRPPKLQPLQCCVFEGSLYFCVEQGKLPRDYSLTYARQETGITLYHVDNVVIADLVVQGFRLDGINAANSARRVRLLGVTCRGNGRSGITIGGVSQVELEGCLAGNNGQAQLMTLPLSETHVVSSSLLPLTAAAWVDRGGQFFLGAKQLHGGLEEIKPE